MAKIVPSKNRKEVNVMYSPKIAEDLIPALYNLSKEKGKPMTSVVDEILRERVVTYKKSKTQKDSETDHPQTRPACRYNLPQL